MSDSDGIPEDSTPPYGIPRPVLTALDTGAPPVSRDDTTRYLCAAAHMDDDFADAAIREYLVEGTRPVPPSPGLDTAAVLGEALAARTRRKLRDAAIVLLMLVFVVLAPAVLLISWIQIAVLFMLPRLITSRKDRKPRWKTWLLVATIAFVTVRLGPLVMNYLFWPFVDILPILPTEVVLSYQEYYIDYYQDLPFGDALFDLETLERYGYSFIDSDTDAETILSIGVIGLMLAVLLSDHFVVWWHLYQRSTRHVGRISIQRAHIRVLYHFSPRRFVRHFAWYVNPQRTMAGPPDTWTNGGGPASVIVYRGYNPFVGAGQPHEPWSIAVPLEPLPDVAEPRKLTTEALYAAISAEVGGLRRSTPLAPGRRLTTMAIREQIIVSAHELIDHLAEPPSADFLHGTRGRPYTMLRRVRVEELKADPLEWARYYQCYQIETWDRDFVVSVYGKHSAGLRVSLAVGV